MKPLPASKWPVWLGALLFLAVSVCLLVHVLSLLFSESLYSKRGSLAYFVTIQEPVIRTFPILQAIGEPLYHSGCGDGPKLPDEAILYHSRLSVADLVARVQPHITSHGFLPVSSESRQPAISFANGRRILELRVSTADDGTTELAAQILFRTE
jgi:hypothetical protein